MPSSQLSQLKAALSSAGVNRKSTSKKDKKAWKKGGAREVDRAKTTAKLEDIRKSLNKFDVRETKVKHDVGGRNIKGVVGRPGVAKQAGLEQRRKTLLPEHQLRNHTGTFSDRRFGESNPSLSIEDRMLERYTRERQRGQGKKGLFNLEDDTDVFGGLDEGDEGTMLGGLTHGGRSVMDLPGDDFDAQGFGEDDEDDEERGDKGRVDMRTVRRDHFGGFGQDQDEELPERKKSKAEVMSEVIAKSKEYKYERQQQRELDDNLRDELDDDIDDLRALLADSAPPTSAGPSRAPAGAITARPPTTTGTGPADGDHPDLDANYDQFVRELAYDARAKPKDRSKTEDELAVEEKDRLEKAEAKRLRRMRGEASEDEEGDEEGGGRGRGKRRKTEKKRGEADDLDDDFEEEELLGPGLTREDIENMEMDDGDEDEDEDEDDDDDEEGDEEDEESGEDEDEDEDEDDEDEDEEFSDMEDLNDEVPDLVEGDEADESGLVRKRHGKSASKPKPKTREIPYTFPCPADVEEFEDLLEGLGDEALPVVVQRIRALHHPSLAQGNKEKLQDFLGVLLDYILILASRPRPALSLINSLHPHLVALVKLNPITAASHFTEKLALMQKNLTRGLARGAANPTSKTLPRAPELALLRLVGLVWSSSDFSHPVVAPAVLLMGQYLGHSRVRSVADLASGLFLCSILAQYESLSKRIVPEALNFIASTILALLPRRKDAAEVTSYPDLQAPGIDLSLSSAVALAPREPVDLPGVLGLDVASDTQAIEQGKADLLSVALRLVQTYAGLYASSEAFIELFAPVSRILEGSRASKLSPELKSLHSTTLSTLTRQLGFARASRQPLSLQSHKPIPIASHTPKFEDDFTPGKRYDPDVERNARNKLKALYKKERKGAIRELRKDNRFLAGEKAKEQRDKDEKYNARMRRVEGEIHVERAEEKAMEREKKREKRRRGLYEFNLIPSSLHPPNTTPDISSLTQTPVPAEVRQAERVSKYTKFWQKDSKDDNDAHKQDRLDAYKDVVNGYYDGATELYEYGWGECFHFCRFYKGEAFLQALARHEHYLAHQLHLAPGARVLDVGCGIGGPAREISRFSDANVTGITINDYQIQRANMKTRKAGLAGKVNFVQGDFMKLSEQFGENAFDAVYAIEATVHAPTFEGIYGEIFKVLKPGGRFGVYEWCMTDAWDPSIPEHKEIAHGIELGDGIAEMRTIADARKALKSVGFNIIHEEDLADRPDPVPWYYPLEGDIMKAQTLWDMLTVFRMTTVGKMITQNGVWALEKVGFVPKGTFDVGESLKTAATYLVKGGQQKLFTPMMLWVVEKPLN